MYLIEYFVLGKRYTAGPYDDNEVKYHFFDIAGYEGVENASIIPVISNQDELNV